MQNDETKDDALILSSEEDRTICLQYLQKGAPIYDSELLLNGIVTQELEFERSVKLQSLLTCNLNTSVPNETHPFFVKALTDLTEEGLRFVWDGRRYLFFPFFLINLIMAFLCTGIGFSRITRRIK